MKRINSLMALVILLAMCLTGCGEKPLPGTIPDNTKSKSPDKTTSAAATRPNRKQEKDGL